MSDPDTTSRPTAAIVAAVAVVTIVSGVAIALFLSGRGDRDVAPVPRPTAVSGAEAPPRIKQAPWRIGKFPAGSVAAMTRTDRRRLRAQRPKVAALIRSLYDAMFLEPHSLKETIKGRFTRPAARSLAASRRVGLPGDATAVETLARTARIGIEATGARRAVASVRVSAVGSVGRRRFHVVHRSTLWLVRSRARWEVIAYQVEQGPRGP